MSRYMSRHPGQCVAALVLCTLAWVVLFVILAGGAR